MAGEAEKFEAAAGSSPCNDEIELVERAKTDPESFGQLYELYYSRILNYVYRRTLDVAAAEEITSNTFYSALRGLPGYRNQGKFGAWLYHIAGNEIRLNWRAQRRRREGDSDWRAEFARVRFAQQAISAEDIEEKQRQFAQLHAAISRLPERYQAVLALRCFEGLSCDEVADVLEKKSGTVRSLIRRGLQRLRRQFGEGQFEKNGATILQNLHYQVQKECGP